MDNAQLKSLAGTIAGLGAPILGGLIGGPVGAIASTVVTAIANQLGTPATPEAVSTAIERNPQSSALVLQELERSRRDDWEALAAVAERQIAETGETMRAELTAQDPVQRYWRPFFAFVWTAICLMFAIVVCRALWQGGTYMKEFTAAIGELSMLLLAFFGAGFGVLGVYVQGRSREKAAAFSGLLRRS